MKTTLKKVARFAIALSIPMIVTTTVTSCQEDVDEPVSIKKGKIKPSPGER